MCLIKACSPKAENVIAVDTMRYSSSPSVLHQVQVENANFALRIWSWASEIHKECVCVQRLEREQLLFRFLL